MESVKPKPAKISEEPRVSARIPAELKGRIQRAMKLTGLDEATVIRLCVEAVCDYIEKHRELKLPLQIEEDRPGKYPAHRDENFLVEDRAPKKTKP